MDGYVIPNGFVAVSGEKIIQVDTMAECPKHWEGDRLDMEGCHVSPGFVDAHCHLGMFGDSLGFEGDDGNESTDPCTPHLRAIDAINPQDRCFADARAAGVTTVVTGPGSANPIGGQMAAIKTSGRWVDTMVIQAPVAMKMALGENPKTVYHDRHETPMTRMATAALIRENLRKAQEYAQRLDQAANGKGDKPDYDAKLDALVPVVQGKLPVHIHAHRADDIATGVRIAKEFGLRCVIVHGTEAHLISELLEQEQIPVITGPCLGDRSKPELTHLNPGSPQLLNRLGVQAAICTDHPETPIQYLPLCAAMAVKNGMDPERALTAITIYPAQIAGIAHRVGSLSPGKDADIVVTRGHPLDLNSRLQLVYCAGQRVDK
jgi:imidazolonepropionase-like amidohydrolase